MRSRVLFIGFVVLNAAFAVVLIYFVTRSGGPSAPALPPTRAGLSPSPAAATLPAPLPPSTRTNEASAPTSSILPNITGPLPPAVPPARVAGGVRTFGWQDVEAKDYLTYLDNLRGAGCPDKMVRQIVFNDCNDLFNQRRLQAAMAHDVKWWMADPQFSIGSYNPEYQAKMQSLVVDRREILSRLLGDNWEQEDKSPSLADHTIPLTGSVLGSMPLELYMEVQEICVRSRTRLEDYRMSRFNEGLGTSEMELAKLRDQTRKDLSIVLNAEQLEEFLLRFSHNAQHQRLTFRGVGLQPEEFRKVFKATDAIDHQIQLDFGGEEALSPKQREQIVRQKEQAVAAVLGQEKYARIVLSRDPLYQKAQRIVMDSGAEDSAIRELFNLLRASDLQRQQVKADKGLSSEDKENALARINQEQLRQQTQVLQKRAP